MVISKATQLNRFKIKYITYLFSLEIWALSTVPGGYPPRSEPELHSWVLIISGQFSITSDVDQAISFLSKSHRYSDPHFNFFSPSQPLRLSWSATMITSYPFPKASKHHMRASAHAPTHIHACTHTGHFSGTPWGSCWPALDLHCVGSPQLCVFQSHELSLGHIILLMALAITDTLPPPVTSSLLPLSDSSSFNLLLVNSYSPFQVQPCIISLAKSPLTL